MSIQQRRKYDSDFKRNAVQLTEESRRAVAAVAENLGIGKDILYRWKREHRSQQGLFFPGNGKEALSYQQQKIRELEKRPKIRRWNEIFYLCPLGNKSNGHLQQDISMKFRFIENNRSSFPVKKIAMYLMCHRVDIIVSVIPQCQGGKSRNNNLEKR